MEGRTDIYKMYLFAVYLTMQSVTPNIRILSNNWLMANSGLE
jgi:hypothetical protein